MLHVNFCKVILESEAAMASDTYNCPQSGLHTIYDCMQPAQRIIWVKLTGNKY